MMRFLHVSEGLIDIAISTVEDLYEDSGGLPNSLVFPRIEDIEAELDRTTVQDLRQAMTVQIVCSSVEALPGFAVPGMRKTFGLCGVVQEVDKVGYILPFLSNLVLHYPALSYIISCCPMLSSGALFCPNLSCIILTCPILSLLVLSYHFLPPCYPILSCHPILSYHFICYQRQDLVLVDVYIRDEGSVVRYWYPVSAVKPQPPAFGRLSSLTFVDQEKASFEIYTELWHCESTMARMYARSGAIKLLQRKHKLMMEKQGEDSRSFPSRSSYSYIA